MSSTGGLIASGKIYIVGEQCSDHLMPNKSDKNKQLHGNVTINMEVNIEQPGKLVIHGAGDHLEATRQR